MCSEDIPNLAEAIAKSRGIRNVKGMNEFQNIAAFENPLLSVIKLA